MMGESVKDIAVQCQYDMETANRYRRKRSIDGEECIEEPAVKKIRLTTPVRCLSPRPFKRLKPTLSPASSSKYQQITSSEVSSLITSPGSIDTRRDESSDTQSQKQFLDLETCIRLNYKYLKDELQPEEIADMSFQDGLIDDEKAIEKISEANNRRLKCDILLKAICKNGNNLSLKHLFNILERKGYAYTIARLEKTIFPENCSCKMPNSLLHTFINDMKPDLLEQIEPLEFIDDILIRGGLSFVDHEDIMNMTHRRDRVKSILDRVENSSGETTHSIVCSITNEYREVFKRFTSGKKEPTIHKKKFVAKSICSTGTEVTHFKKITMGASVNIKLNFRSSNDGSEELKSIEKNIVKNYDSQKSQQAHMHSALMEDCMSHLKKMSFSSVVLHLKAMSSKSSKLLMLACENGNIASWILDLLTDEDINTLNRLHVDHLDLEISTIREDEENDISCSCKLTREFITLNYALLSKEMRGSRAIAKRFNESGLLSNDEVQELSHVTRSSDITLRNCALLEFVLKSGCLPVLRCVMEKEILQHCSAEDTIIKLLREDNQVKEMSGLKPQDIINNRKFLAEELDGKTFIREIGTQNKQVKDRLLALETRKERTNIFLEFLCSQSNNLAWFEEALKKRKMDYILDKIYLSNENTEVTDVSVLASNYKLLLDEIEPRRLVEYLECASILNELDAHEITGLSSRKDRSARMLQGLFKNTNSKTVETFIMALEYAGYDKIAKQVRNGNKTTDKCTYACPLISLLDSNSPELDQTLIYKGAIEIGPLRSSNIEDVPCVKIIKKCSPCSWTGCDQCVISSESSESHMTLLTHEEKGSNHDTTIVHIFTHGEYIEKSARTHQWIRRHFPCYEGLTSDGFLLPQSPGHRPLRSSVASPSSLARSICMTEENRSVSSTASHESTSVNDTDTDSGVVLGKASPKKCEKKQHSLSKALHHCTGWHSQSCQCKFKGSVKIEMQEIYDNKQEK